MRSYKSLIVVNLIVEIVVVKNIHERELRVTTFSNLIKALKTARTVSGFPFSFHQHRTIAPTITFTASQTYGTFPSINQRFSLVWFADLSKASETPIRVTLCSIWSKFTAIFHYDSDSSAERIKWLGILNPAFRSTKQLKC